MAVSMEHGIWNQTSLSPGYLIWVVLPKPTFHQVPYLQNGSDSTFHRIVVKIK